MYKKIICFILTLLIILTLFSSCKSDNSTNDYGEKVTNVYKSEQIKMPEDYTFLRNNMGVHNDNIYTFCDNGSKSLIYIIDLNGENDKIIYLKEEKDFRNYSFTVLSENEFILNVENSLYKIDEYSNMTEIFNLLDNIDELGFYKKMLIKNDNIYLIGNYIIYIFTTKGEFLNQIKSSYIEDVTERNGVLYVQLNSRYDEYEYKYIINEDTMEIENIHDYISIPVDIEQGIYGDKIIMGDDEYDIYFRGTIGLYGYNKSDEKTTLLVDWQNSDIYEPIVSITSIISPDKIICAKFRDFSRSTYQIFDKILILNKVPDEDVVPKILLTMPLLYDEDFLLMLASEFNMVNDKYRIVFTDYSKYINRQEPGIQYDKFNLDLTTGKIPDIILVNQYLMPVRSYLSKGLFTDLYTFYLNEQR